MHNLISIIVPLYNKAMWVSRCFDSICSQLHSNFECIIIDDGSSDGSDEIVEKYLKDKRFVYIRTENHGVSAARNTGIVHAKGEYLTFVDADDVISERYLTALLDGLEKSNADIVSVARIGFCDSEKMIFDEGWVFRRVDPLTLLKEYFGFPGRLFRAHLFKGERGVLFPEGLGCEDNALTPIIASSANLIVSSSTALYGYRQIQGARLVGSKAVIVDFFEAMEWMLDNSPRRECAIFTYFFSLHNCLLVSSWHHYAEFWARFLRERSGNSTLNQVRELVQPKDDLLFEGGVRKYFKFLSNLWVGPILILLVYRALHNPISVGFRVKLSAGHLC